MEGVRVRGSELLHRSYGGGWKSGKRGPLGRHWITLVEDDKSVSRETAAQGGSLLVNEAG